MGGHRCGAGSPPVWAKPASRVQWARALDHPCQPSTMSLAAWSLELLTLAGSCCQEGRWPSHPPPPPPRGWGLPGESLEQKGCSGEELAFLRPEQFRAPSCFYSTHSAVPLSDSKPGCMLESLGRKG